MQHRAICRLPERGHKSSAIICCIFPGRSRCTATLAGLRTLIQTAHGPDRRVPSALVEMMPSAPSRQACANTVGTSSATRSLRRVPASILRPPAPSAQRLFTVEKWPTAQVLAVMLDQVEGIELWGSLATAELFEPGQTVRPYPRPPRRRPVKHLALIRAAAAATAVLRSSHLPYGYRAHCGTIPAHDHPAAVMLDLVNPILPGGRS
jgi:hypothetical protein